METVWFCLVAIMIAIYVVLDGFDLGAGAIHLLVARNEAERRVVLRTIGPVWDGNEVWLLAAGGTLYFAFPALYASSFSGFYLPLMIVLWLLILRGIAVEGKFPVCMIVGLLGKEPDVAPTKSNKFGVKIIEPILDTLGIEHHLVETDADVTKIEGESYRVRESEQEAAARRKKKP